MRPPYATITYIMHVRTYLENRKRKYFHLITRTFFELVRNMIMCLLLFYLLTSNGHCEIVLNFMCISMVNRSQINSKKILIVVYNFESSFAFCIAASVVVVVHIYINWWLYK